MVGSTSVTPLLRLTQTALLCLGHATNNLQLFLIWSFMYVSYQRVEHELPLMAQWVVVCHFWGGKIGVRGAKRSESSIWRVVWTTESLREWCRFSDSKKHHMGVGPIRYAPVMKSLIAEIIRIMSLYVTRVVFDSHQSLHFSSGFIWASSHMNLDNFWVEESVLSWFGSCKPSS